MRTTVFAGIFSVTLAGIVPSAQAVVRSVSAEIRGEVQAFVNDQAESSDLAIENFGGTGLTPPITVRANLQHLDSENAAIAEAIAAADFRDPTQGGPQRNPGEIGIEADCYSNEPATRYEMNSSVVERRVIVFDASELGDPLLGRQTVRSAVFASGAIFAWSIDANRDLTGLFGEVSFVIRRIETDEAGDTTDETVLLDQTVALRGGPNGSITLDNDSDLFVFAGDISILPAAQESIGAIPQVDLDSLGSAQVAIILQQDIEYEYEAQEDQELILEATFTTRIANLPDGTGVVAVFGRSFDDASDILENGIPDQGAKTLQSRLNRAIAEFELPGDQTLVGVTSVPAACGTLGFEIIPFLGLVLLMFAVQPGRAPRRP